MSVVKIIRHSISNDGETLSLEGERRAKEYGKILREQYPNYRIIAYSSKAGRAKKTAELIMNSAGIDPRQITDERLSYSYTMDEMGRITDAIRDLGLSPLEAAIREAQGTLYRDILKLAGFIDQYNAESANDIIYIGVTHSPTIEGIEYIVTNYNALRNEPEHLKGFTLNDGLFIPDRAISCNSLVEMCRSGWKLIFEDSH
jgi:broad specificity phosphatase PhoE